MTFLIFLFSSFALLSMPGPTNALLIVVGATESYSVMTRLLTAQALTYLASLSLLNFILSPLIGDSDGLMKILRLFACVILFVVAFRLWRTDTSEKKIADPVSLPVMIMVTFFNPKIVVFVFGVFPEYKMGVFPVLIVTLLTFITGGIWIAIGKWFGQQFGCYTSKLGAGFLTLCGITIATMTLR